MAARQCIWCRGKEPRVSFRNDAHIVPQSLGGKRICPSVCDGCNAYFGRTESGRPAIETVIKETLSLSRESYRRGVGRVTKRQKPKRYTSLYFNADFDKRSVKVKPAYRVQTGLQTRLARQFRRGIYKMVLETIEADTGTALEEQYDFIREFARYDLGEYPVFYFLRRVGIVLLVDKVVNSPEIYFEEGNRMKYLVHTDSFFEFELLTHVFGIALRKRADIMLAPYARRTRELKRQLFYGMVDVKFFNDVDLLMHMFKEDGGYERWLKAQYGERLVLF